MYAHVFCMYSRCDTCMYILFCLFVFSNLGLPNSRTTLGSLKIKQNIKPSISRKRRQLTGRENKSMKQQKVKSKIKSKGFNESNSIIAWGNSYVFGSLQKIKVWKAPWISGKKIIPQCWSHHWEAMLLRFLRITISYFHSYLGSLQNPKPIKTLET